MSVREIEEMVAALPPNELDEFARWFEDYIDADHPPPEIPEAEWLAELKRRSDEIDAGTAKLYTWEEVRDRVRAKYEGPSGG